MLERDIQASTKATKVSLENSLVDSVFMQLQKAFYITLHSQEFALLIYINNHDLSSVLSHLFGDFASYLSFLCCNIHFAAI